jgi:hypothetical protein
MNGLPCCPMTAIIIELTKFAHFSELLYISIGYRDTKNALPDRISLLSVFDVRGGLAL